MSYTVYKHKSPSGKIYIGITSQDVLKRWKNGCGYQKNKYFYNAIRKYGWGNFKHEILVEGLDKKEAEEKEIELIAFYKSNNRCYGYNRNLGGQVKGKVSEETRQKLRISHLGKTLTQEHKAKISKSLKGRKTSKGTLGYRHSEETKLKMAKARLGKVGCAGKQHHKARAVINLTTGEIFETMTAACLKYNLDHSAISLCCRGLRKSHGKFKWAYKGGGVND